MASILADEQRDHAIHGFPPELGKPGHGR